MCSTHVIHPDLIALDEVLLLSRLFAVRVLRSRRRRSFGPSRSFIRQLAINYAKKTRNNNHVASTTGKLQSSERREEEDAFGGAVVSAAD